MQLWANPPSVPREWRDRLGEPEQVFGPNVRYRVIARICGVAFVILGMIFFLRGFAGGAKLPLADLVSDWLTTPLLGFGIVILIGLWLIPLNWIVICPKGLIRTRGSAWQGIRWDDVDLFEDATLTHKMITARQCRIVLKGGDEWGFLADNFANYDRLFEVIRLKIKDNSSPPPLP